MNRVAKIHSNAGDISSVNAHKKVKDECAALSSLLKTHKKHFSSKELQRLKRTMDNVSKRVANLNLSAVKKKSLRNVFKRKATRAQNVQLNFKRKITTYLRNITRDLNRYEKTIFRSFPTQGPYAIADKSKVASLRWEAGGGARSHIRVPEGYTTESYNRFLSNIERQLNELLVQTAHSVEINNIFNSILEEMGPIQDKVDEMRALLKRWNSLSPGKRAKLRAVRKNFKRRFNANLEKAKHMPVEKTNAERNNEYESYYGYYPRREREYIPKPRGYSPFVTTHNMVQALTHHY